MNKKNLIYYINLVFIVLIMIGDVLYLELGTLICKSITSALFVMLGLVNLIYAFKRGETNKKFSITILTGLFFAMLGDILLQINFIIGAILFAIGHIIFFASYICLNSFKLTDLCYGIAIIIPAILIITLAPFFDFKGNTMKILCIAYAIIISFMVGKAISNFIAKRTQTNMVVLLGSVLFFFSDLMLLFHKFAGGKKVFSYLCLLTYYPAEILLAISILVTSIFYNKENAIFQQKQVRAEQEDKK